jgi:HEAT repeat protein
MPKSQSHPSTDDQLIARCLEVLQSGQMAECYKILPRLGVAKDRRVLPVLRQMLFSGERCREELAVCALAALGCRDTLPWLFEKLVDPAVCRGPGSQKFQSTILDAVGEIGDDAASPHLAELFRRRLPRDGFRRKRQVIIIDTLGAIAQQGGKESLDLLVNLLEDADFLVRAHAVSNIATAFWHRPDDLPDPIFERLLSLFKDSNLYVQHALLSALESLADIGCRRAAQLFSD